MQIIDGKATAALLQERIAAQVDELVAQGNRRPHLAAVLVGHDVASETYVANKLRACVQCKIDSTLVRLEDDVTEQQILDEIDRLNANPEIDGFIVQLPLPPHINANRVIEAIDYHKDVDGFHPMNVGLMSLGLPCILPATPQGILMLFEQYNIPTRGANCVVVGRSNIAGRPIASMLARKCQPGDCTVTLCHSETKNLKEITRQADILITAVGKPGLITADMVKEGAAVLDMGITRLPSTTAAGGYRLCGDVDFDNVAPRCSFITPVPGGVGPMTIASLMLNTLLAAQGTVYNDDDITGDVFVNKE
ncbi:MAG: bifunctional 5,10-methylene-tetrahydrofolate dehydrogenase/5,10-methylene-tetrahydrofolate cyclohydrolase [Muribaculaceae bacterium]|nr:bifunctional 5,10-methylene-tetrahydrofolate dehydrogenase/5,10-methylene-tetrahydrofolate cyclohydrolase [Muribaculaceae bacterium]